MTCTKEVVKTDNSIMLSPFGEIERWFNEVWSRPSSLFGASLLPAGYITELTDLSPSVDMFEEGNDIVLKVDLPGVRKEDLKIDIADNILTITGEKKREEKVEKDDYYRFERSHGCFNRRFDLPEGMDAEKVKAHLENGVLEVRMPKTEETASKKITVKIE